MGPFGWCKIAEGADVAIQLAAAGITGVVLHYRLPAGRPEVPMRDMLDAVSTTRSLHSSGWLGKARQRNQVRVGVIGFSAGGHLAALGATRFTSPETRPDLLMLFYPVVSLENHTHANTRREFLGAAPSPELTRTYSADQQMSHATPPAFLAHALDDRVVASQSSSLYLDACRTHGVACTGVLLQTGGHPFVNKPHAWDPAWAAALQWLRTIGPDDTGLQGSADTFRASLPSTNIARVQVTSRSRVSRAAEARFASLTGRRPTAPKARSGGGEVRTRPPPWVLETFDDKPFGVKIVRRRR